MAEKNSLWKNIRANRGSGKKPTLEMLRQERKIKAKQYAEGSFVSEDENGIPYRPLSMPMEDYEWKGRPENHVKEPVKKSTANKSKPKEQVKSNTVSNNTSVQSPMLPKYLPKDLTGQELEDYLYRKTFERKETPYNPGGISTSDQLQAIGEHFFNPKRANSVSENLLEIIDPTGILSWDDASTSYNSKNPTSFESISNYGSAIPVLGKIPQVAKSVLRSWNAINGAWDVNKDNFAEGGYYPTQGPPKALFKGYAEGGEDDKNKNVVLKPRSFYNLETGLTRDIKSSSDNQTWINMDDPTQTIRHQLPEFEVSAEAPTLQEYMEALKKSNPTEYARRLPASGAMTPVYPEALLAAGPAANLAKSAIVGGSRMLGTAMAAPLTVGSRTLPWLTAGDVVNAGFGLHGAHKLGSDLSSGYYTSDASIGNKIARGLGTGLDLAFVPGAKNFSNIVKDRLSKATEGTSNLFKEIKGELLQGKENRKSIKKGNEWLENWINHPATQKKIDETVDNVIDIENKNFEELNKRVLENSGVTLPDDYLKSTYEYLELLRNQAKNFKPKSKEYSLLKQTNDNLKQYLLSKAEAPIHEGNWGVSYMHNVSPADRLNIELGLQKPFSRYGSWISRTEKLPQIKRASTTVHEGTHDWVPAESFKKLGIRNTALKNMNSDIKKDFLEWEKHQLAGDNPINIMGKEKAYQGYLGDPTEQHARIMELRKQLNLTPDEVITPEYASQIIEWIDAGGSLIDPKFLNVIDKDPKKLADLFNKFWAAAPLTIGAGVLQQNNQSQQQATGGYTMKNNKSWREYLQYARGGIYDESLDNNTFIDDDKNKYTGKKALKSPLNQGYTMAKPAMDWYSNWVSDPEFTERLTANFPADSTVDKFDRLLTTGTDKEVREARTESLLSSHRKYIPKLVKDIKDTDYLYNADPTINDQLFDDYSKRYSKKELAEILAQNKKDNPQGFTDFTGTAVIRNRANEPGQAGAVSVAGHEIPHQVGAYTGELDLGTGMRKFQRFDEAFANKFSMPDNSTWYLDSETGKPKRPDKKEFYPFLMQLRMDNKIEPGEIIDDARLDAIRKSGSTNPLLKFYDNEKLKKYLNTLASNKTQQQLQPEETYMQRAATGGYYAKGGKTDNDKNTLLNSVISKYIGSDITDDAGGKGYDYWTLKLQNEDNLNEQEAQHVFNAISNPMGNRTPLYNSIPFREEDYDSPPDASEFDLYTGSQDRANIRRYRPNQNLEARKPFGYGELEYAQGGYTNPYNQYQKDPHYQYDGGGYAWGTFNPNNPPEAPAVQNYAMDPGQTSSQPITTENPNTDKQIPDLNATANAGAKDSSLQQSVYSANVAGLPIGAAIKVSDSINQGLQTGTENTLGRKFGLEQGQKDIMFAASHKTKNIPLFGSTLGKFGDMYNLASGKTKTYLKDYRRDKRNQEIAMHADLVNESLKYSQGGNMSNNSLNLRNTMRNKRFAKGGTFDQFGINFIPESAGLHHESANGGVPIGPNALAEGGEAKLQMADGSQYIVSGEVDGANTQSINGETMTQRLKKKLKPFMMGGLASNPKDKENVRRPFDSYSEPAITQAANAAVQETEAIKMQRGGALQYAANGGKLNKDIEKIVMEEYAAAYGGMLPNKYKGKVNMPGSYAKGGIHIKPENKGKFTASAKAAGHTVQEHARAVLNNPNATPLQKKRANFARNAAKWKHADGGYVYNPMTQPMLAEGGSTWVPSYEELLSMGYAPDQIEAIKLADKQSPVFESEAAYNNIKDKAARATQIGDPRGMSIYNAAIPKKLDAAYETGSTLQTLKNSEKRPIISGDAQRNKIEDFDKNKYPNETIEDYEKRKRRERELSDFTRAEGGPIYGDPASPYTYAYGGMYGDPYYRGGQIDYTNDMYSMYAGGGPMVGNAPQAFKGYAAQNRGGMLMTYADGGMMPQEQQMMQEQQMQQQGGQEQMMQMVQQVAQAIMQGENPEQIMQQLMQSGMPPEQAQQIMQAAMQMASQQQQQQPQGQPMQQGQQMMPQQGMMSSGGKLPKEILRARVQSHMSPKEASSYVNNYSRGGKMYYRGGPDGPPYDLPGMADMTTSEYDSINSYLTNLNTPNVIDNQGNTSSILNRMSNNSNTTSSKLRGLGTPNQSNNIISEPVNPNTTGPNGPITEAEAIAGGYKPPYQDEIDYTQIPDIDSLYAPNNLNRLNPNIGGMLSEVFKASPQTNYPPELPNNQLADLSKLPSQQYTPFFFDVNANPGDETTMPDGTTFDGNVYNTQTPIDHYYSNQDVLTGFSNKYPGDTTNTNNNLNKNTDTPWFEEPLYSKAARYSQAIPGIAAAITGMKNKKRRLDPTLMAAQKVNYEPERIIDREESRRALDAGLRMQRNSAANAGMLAANTTSAILNANKGLAGRIAESVMREGNTNAQLAQQADLTNVANKNQFKQLNEQMFQNAQTQALAGFQDTTSKLASTAGEERKQYLQEWIARNRLGTRSYKTNINGQDVFVNADGQIYDAKTGTLLSAG